MVENRNIYLEVRKYILCTSHIIKYIQRMGSSRSVSNQQTNSDISPLFSEIKKKKSYTKGD